MRRLALLLFALALALAAAGCGGSSHKFEPVKGLVGGGGSPQASSAGTSENYEPSGDIIADNGFRSDPNGFGFENYGNDAGPQNMVPANVEALFGNQVCASGTGASCRLTPVAQQWMDIENERMAGGHCMGFSVTALRFFANNLPLAPFGADETVKLPVQGNVALQSQIAEDWTFQDLQTVTSNKIGGTPSHILDALIDALKSGGGSNRSSAYPSLKELYTIVFFKPDGSGGHAVTPYAVEDKGDGKYAILIYDNNFPGVTRAIDVDTNADKWTYNGGTNPSDLNEHYEGDASTQSLFLYPTSPGLGRQPCPFCGGESSSGGSSAGSVGSTLAGQYNQVTLTGSPTNHAHLVLRDAQGRLTGFLDGKIVNQIPGVQVVQTLSNQSWNVAPEPAYRFPASKILAVIVDAGDLKKPDKESITLIGPGFYGGVEEIELFPGERDILAFGGGGHGFVYRTTAGHVSTPGLAVGVQEGNDGYAMGVAAAGTKGGSQIALYTHPSGVLTWDTAGTKGSAYKGFAIYVVEIQKITAHGNAVWSSAKLVLKKGWRAALDYRHAVPGKPIKVFSGPPGHVVLVQKLPPGNNLPSS